MSSLRDIANACGVSISAVSDILNRGRADKYRPETVDRVLAAIQEMGYQPDRVAQSMRSRRTRVIAFAAPNVTAEGRLENGGVYPFLVGLSHGLSPHGYHVALIELEEIEPEKNGEGVLPPVFRERFFDAIALQYGLSETAIRLATERAEVPILRWDSNDFAPENCLRRDEDAVTREAMRRLFALGHKRIAYLVGGPRWDRYQAGLRVDHYSYAARYDAYADEMRGRGLAPMPMVEYTPEHLLPQIEQFRPTAIIAPEADGARAAIDAVQIAGLRVPQDLTVATLDREPKVREVGRVIGGMTYDRLSVGREAAAPMLREMLESGVAVPSREEVFGRWWDGATVGLPACC